MPVKSPTHMASGPAATSARPSTAAGASARLRSAAPMRSRASRRWPRANQNQCTPAASRRAASARRASGWEASQKSKAARRLSFSSSRRSIHPRSPSPPKMCGSAASASATKASRWRARASSVSPRSARRSRRVPAHGLEQPVAAGPRGCGGRQRGLPAREPPTVEHDERLVDEVGEQVEHVAAGDGLGGLQREAPREDGEAAQQRLLVVGEELVAPVDGRLQGAVAGERGAAPVGEQAEAIVEPRRDLRDREHPRARRRELDGERDAVEPLADLGHHGRVVALARALLEESDRLGRDQRRHAEGVLAGEAQRLAAGGQDREIGAVAEQAIREPARRVEEVLAVVEDEEHAPAPQRRHQHVEGRAPRRVVHAQDRGHRGHQEDRIGERRELDEPGAAGEIAREIGRHLHGQPRLPDAARPGERDQPGRADARGDLAQLLDAADERRERARDPTGGLQEAACVRIGAHRGDQRGHRGVAVLGPGREAAHDRAVDPRGHGRRRGRSGRRARLLQRHDLVDPRAGAGDGEGQHAVEPLVERRAEAVLVRRRARPRALVLFRRHVERRAHDRARRGQRLGAGAAIAGAGRMKGGALRSELRRPSIHGDDGGASIRAPHVLLRRALLGRGEAEVDDAHAAVRAAQDVGGLDVAVDEPLVVRRREPPRRVEVRREHGAPARGCGGLPRRGRRRAAPRVERLPLDQLHRDEHVPLVLAHVVHLHHVGVGELAERARLAEQPPPRAGGAPGGAQALEGDAPIELGVVGRVDLSHAAAANQREDAVTADRRPVADGLARRGHERARQVALPPHQLVDEGTARAARREVPLEARGDRRRAPPVEELDELRVGRALGGGGGLGRHRCARWRAGGAARVPLWPKVSDRMLASRGRRASTFARVAPALVPDGRVDRPVRLVDLDDEQMRDPVRRVDLDDEHGPCLTGASTVLSGRSTSTTSTRSILSGRSTSTTSRRREPCAWSTSTTSTRSILSGRSTSTTSTRSILSGRSTLTTSTRSILSGRSTSTTSRRSILSGRSTSSTSRRR